MGLCFGKHSSVQPFGKFWLKGIKLILSMRCFNIFYILEHLRLGKGAKRELSRKLNIDAVYRCHKSFVYLRTPCTHTWAHSKQVSVETNLSEIK